MLKLFLRPVAKSEIQGATEWYDSKATDLGDAFLFEIEHTFSFIREHPLSFPRTRFQSRKAKLRRFPYCIYYYILKDRIVVSACLHNSRNVDKILEKRV